MHGDEFLWEGLRTRLERMGRIRPRTGTTEATRPRADRVQARARFHPAQPALRSRVPTTLAGRP